MSYNVLAALISWLAEKTSLSVYFNVPEDRPGEFITVRRAGGGSDLGRDRPAIEICAWAQRDLEAYELALEIRDLLIYDARADLNEVCAVTTSSIIDRSGTAQQPCWQVSAVLTTRL